MLAEASRGAEAERAVPAAHSLEILHCRGRREAYRATDGLPRTGSQQDARCLREGVHDVFTLQRINVPPSLWKCLATTNLIESPQSGVRKRTL